ncbi:MAG: alpha-glucosidase, partial [Anaerolineae bacterium]|nr:alpha-glucosidase [Anaerolineae bacterium]
MKRLKLDSIPVMLIALVVPLLALLIAAFFAASIRQRQLAGRYEGVIADTSARVGAFTVAWNASTEQVVIVNDANPGHIVWESVPGQPFIMAAQGVLEVRESRAHVTIDDTLSLRCLDQSIEAMQTEGDTVTISGQLHCLDNTAMPYTISFTAEADDRLAFEAHYEARDEAFNRILLTYASDKDEHFFGFGEQFSVVDMKGRRLPIYVMEQGIGRGAQPITIGADLTAGAGGNWWTTYAGVPQYVTSAMRSLYLANTQYSVFDLRRDDRAQVTVFSTGVSGAVFYGETPAELITAYTAVVGRMRPLPGWLTSGAVIGMQGGTERVREVYAQAQAYDVPVAAFLLQDWVGQRTTSFGKQLWWNWELDEERYPGWDALVSDLNTDGVRVMTYVSPFLVDVFDKPGVERDLYEEAAKAGYLVETADGQPYLIQNTDFSAALVDFTNPDAREWYKQVIRDQVIGVGAAGFMADFGEGLPYDAVLHSGEAGMDVHNQYPVLWAEIVREAIDESENGAEIIAFHRSGYTTSPRYATLFWLGDQLVSW